MSDETIRRCGAPTKRGTPCQAFLNLNPVSGRCVHHDPARAAEAAELHRKGGLSSGKTAKLRAIGGMPGAEKESVLESLSGLIKVEAGVIARTLNGMLDARTSEALTRAIREQRLNIDRRDVQTSIAALRKELKEARRDQKRQIPTMRALR